MIIAKIIRSLLTISVSLTSFSTFSASISLGTVKGLHYTADTTFVPVDIENYQQYKEVKLKMNAIKKISNEFNPGDYGEGVIWIDCKNNARISKFLLFFNSDGSLKEKVINAGETPSSFLEKNESNSPLHNLCQNISTLIQHPTLTRNSKNINDYKELNKLSDIKSPTMSKDEYKQKIRDMDKQLAILSSHRSRLFPGRDTEDPNILTEATKTNHLLIPKKDLELTCEKLRILKQQENFILDQNFFTKDLDLVTVYDTMWNEKVRIKQKSNSIREQGGMPNVCPSI